MGHSSLVEGGVLSPAVDYSRLAEYYDVLVATEADIPFFLEECREIGGRVLELMSGTGRIAVPLATAGVDLTCVDSSPEMLQKLQGKLRTRGLSAEVLLQDVTRLQMKGGFDLVILAFNSFEELVDPGDEQRTVEAVFRALEPGGRFVCSLHNPTVALQSLPREPTVVARIAVEQNELILQLDVAHDANTGIVEGTETLSMVDPRGRLLSRVELSLRYRLIEEGYFRKLVEGCGFRVVDILGDYPDTPYERWTSPSMIWRLQKGTQLSL